jgi:pimeloyl-ACP methyl ester carboxylesterase
MSNPIALTGESVPLLVVSPPARRPPIVLVHGAANSAVVWRFWQEELIARGWPARALDLRGHGARERVDLSDTGMADYAADVATFARGLGRPPVLVGWSMGGLAVMMAAAGCEAVACVGLAPSPPARARDASVPLRPGVFGPEEYGIVDRDPERQPMMPDLDREERLVAFASLGLESRRARDERKAGVVLDTLPCPLLVVTGSCDTQLPTALYRDLHLSHDLVTVDGASHWGLVLNRRVLPRLASAVTDWLGKATNAS